MTPNSASALRHTIGGFEFRQEHGTLVYATARTSLARDTVAAIGIAAIAFGSGLFLVERKPLRDLLSEGDAWNTAAALALFLFSLALTISIPLYLRRSGLPFTIDAAKGAVFFNGQEVTRLDQPTAVRVEFLPNPDHQTYHLAVECRAGRVALLLLDFEDENDARRAADVVAEHLGVPVR